MQRKNWVNALHAHNAYLYAVHNSEVWRYSKYGSVGDAKSPSPPPVKLDIKMPTMHQPFLKLVMLNDRYLMMCTKYKLYFYDEKENRADAQFPDVVSLKQDEVYTCMETTRDRRLVRELISCRTLTAVFA